MAKEFDKARDFMWSFWIKIELTSMACGRDST